MPKLIIKNLRSTRVPILESSNTLLFCIQTANVDWMHACGGKGRCTTCRMRILEGWDNLSSLSEAELKFKNRGHLREDERLACQCRSSGDVIAEVPKPCQLPHLGYTE